LRTERVVVSSSSGSRGIVVIAQSFPKRGREDQSAVPQAAAARASRGYR
jgi:hypothetical protein